MAVPTFQYATQNPADSSDLSLPQPGAPILWTIPFPKGDNPGKNGRSRGLVKKLISRYLHVDVSRILIRETACGKPYLDQPDSPALFFNLSHTGSLLIVLFSTDGEVGVDIERLDRSVRVTEIARHFFHPTEQAALQALPPADRPAAFFRLWTEKEAFVKGIGTGLRLPTDAFYFVPDTRESKKVILDTDRLTDKKALPEDLSSWRVFRLDGPPGTIASAALSIQ